MRTTERCFGFPYPVCFIHTGSLSVCHHSLRFTGCQATTLQYGSILLPFLCWIIAHCMDIPHLKTPYSLVDGHVGCYDFLIVIANASVNIYGVVIFSFFCWMCSEEWSSLTKWECLFYYLFYFIVSYVCLYMCVWLYMHIFPHRCTHPCVYM